MEDDSIESLKDEYSIDEDYDMLIHEVNSSMKKIFFSINKDSETEK